MRVKLTDRFIAGAKSGSAAQADYFDEGTPGLALRVSSAGRKAWSFVFTSPKDGRRARLSLGSYPAVSLADARARAIEARGHLAEIPPRDPRDVRRAEVDGAMTVKDLTDSYMEKHIRPTRRSAAETERRFAKNITPVIGSVRLADLHKRDINRVVDPILARESPVEAARTFEDLRAMLRWAVRRGDLDRNPMEGMGKPSKAEARERVLSDEEIRVFWNGLPKALARSKACQRILKLCLLTGQRVGEVAGMTRVELDLAKVIWTIPAARSKNGHTHAVPLSDAALDIVREALKEAGEKAEYVFPNPEGDGSLPAAAVARTVTRAAKADPERPFGRFGIARFTAHDLRRTAVSKMAELGVAPIVLGHVINHRSVTKAGLTLAVYSRYDYAKEKREALELWAKHLSAIVENKAGQVVAMQPKAPAK